MNRHCRNSEGWRVFDLDKKEVIPFCVWADTDTGEYECCALTLDGKLQHDRDRTQVLTAVRRGRIALVPPGGALPVIVEAK